MTHRFAGWTFGRFIDHVADHHRALPAMAASDHSRAASSDVAPPLRRWTYEEMGRDIQALQWALSDLGVAPGERVGVMLSSFPEWVLYLFAITRLGATFVPINMRFKSRELQHVLSHSGSRTLIATGRYLGHDHTATIAEVCGAMRPDGGFTALPELRRIIGVGPSPHPAATDTQALLAQGYELLAARGVPPRTENAQDVAILFYTSGTTSFPKGVPLTHANLLVHSVRAGELLDLQPGEKVLSLYPFFGISGGANKVLSTLGCGACLVFQDAWRPQEACELLASEDCTVVHGVDVQIRELIACQRRMPAGAVPERRATIAFMVGVDEAMGREMGEVLGIRRFIHPYGMTETNPMVLRNELNDPFEVSIKPGGRIAPDVEIRVVDPKTEQDSEVGIPGEIVMRGATVTKHYFNDPDATAAAFRGGWFHSGDYGVRTEDGMIFYVGRLKDMLKVGGFNVAPQEVESLLRTHPAIEDVAVTSIPDARLGEVVGAFVMLKAGQKRVTADELRDFAKENLANFKVPRQIWFVDALPYHTAANGSKLQRQVLREWVTDRLNPTNQQETAS